jgi:riboflavin biosynthesis pyrimidine reductase
VRQLLPPPADRDAVGVDLDTAYAVPALGHGDHHLRVNFVISVDGAAEVGGRSGPLGGEGDHRIFRHLRWLSDVILVGAATVNAENYGPAKIPPDRQALRVAAGLAPVPPIAVLSGRLSLDPASRLFAEGPATGQAGAPAPRPLVLTTELAPTEKRVAFADVADVVVAGGSSIDARAAVAALAERGLRRVLCEGGPSLHTELAAAGLVDELCLTVSPLLAGPERIRITAGERWGDPRDLALVHVLEEDGALFLRYRRR